MHSLHNLIALFTHPHTHTHTHTPTHTHTHIHTLTHTHTLTPLHPHNHTHTHTHTHTPTHTHTHIHTHTHTCVGEHPYVCETCGEGFGSPSNLKDHLYTHTKEKSTNQMMALPRVMWRLQRTSRRRMPSSDAMEEGNNEEKTEPVAEAALDSLVNALMSAAEPNKEE